MNYVKFVFFSADGLFTSFYEVRCEITYEIVFLEAEFFFMDPISHNFQKCKQFFTFSCFNFEYICLLTLCYRVTVCPELVKLKIVLNKRPRLTFS